MDVREAFKHKTTWRIKKFANDLDWKNGKPFSESKFDGNVLLNEGIDELCSLIATTGGTLWNAANAYLGVGNGITAEAPTDTGLLGASKLYKAMDGTYPQIGSQKVTWRSTFTSGEANFAWEEFTVANSGSDAGDNLNRKTSTEGTKTAGQTWELTLEITFS